MNTCLNCSAPLQDKFCSRCGQKASTHRFTMAHVLHEIPHSLFHLDSGIFRNIRSITYPKRAVLEYVAGKRKIYFNPLLFYFLLLGLYLFLAPLFNTDTVIVLQVPWFDVEGYNQGRWINPFAKFLFFCCAFIFAVPNYYFFRKETGFTYPEQVVACFFILGYAMLISLLALPFVKFGPINRVLVVLVIGFTFLVYYRGNWWKTLLKSLAAALLSFLLFALTLGFIAFVGYLVLLVRG